MSTLRLPANLSQMQASAGAAGSFINSQVPFGWVQSCLPTHLPLETQRRILNGDNKEYKAPIEEPKTGCGCFRANEKE